MMSVPPLLNLDAEALFLDFDGTLVELAERPDAIVVPDSLIAILHELSDRMNGRVALISGRSIDTLDQFGMDGLAIAGSHGAEWRLQNGDRHATDRPQGLDAIRAAFAEFAALREGVIVEDKPLGAALHFRMAPGEGDRAIALAERLAAQYSLHVQHGHAMVELRRAGIDKGHAIAAMLRHAPFAAHRPVFLGDDVTDEAGFACVNRQGGHGVLVGEERQSEARFRLDDVAAVNDWLTSSLSNTAVQSAYATKLRGNEP